MSGFQSPIVGGSANLVRPAIQSPNYVAGTIGWIISKDGSAEFNGATIRGELRVDGTGQAYILIYERVAPNRPTIELNPNVVGAVPAEIFADGGQLYIGAPALPPEVAGATLVLDSTNPGVHSAQFFSGQAGATFRLDVSGQLAMLPGQDDPHITVNGVDGMQQWYHGVMNPANVGPIGGAGVETTFLTLPAQNYIKNRAYKVEFNSLYNVSVAPNRPIWQVRKTNNVGQLLNTADFGAVNTAQHTASYSFIFTVGAASLMNVVLVATLQSNSAAFTVTSLGNATTPTSLQVYDVGSSSNHPNAPVLV